MGKGKLWKKGKRKGCRKRGEAGKGRSQKVEERCKKKAVREGRREKQKGYIVELKEKNIVLGKRKKEKRRLQKKCEGESVGEGKSKKGKEKIEEKS